MSISKWLQLNLPVTLVGLALDNWFDAVAFVVAVVFVVADRTVPVVAADTDVALETAVPVDVVVVVFWIVAVVVGYTVVVDIVVDVVVYVAVLEHIPVSSSPQALTILGKFSQCNQSIGPVNMWTDIFLSLLYQAHT